MKKIISLLCLTAIMLSMSITALAGSIPEDLLHSDDAQIFFAEVVAFQLDDGNENYGVEFVPIKKIKGDVKLEVKQTAFNFNTIGDFEVKRGNVYLFTYFDENNPTDIFEVTSYDTSTLKLKNVEGDMWKRFEQYLNEGRYLDAEQARLDKQNENLPIEGEDISLVELIGVPKEKAEEVKIHYQRAVYEIDVDKFYKAIDDIVLTDIEDVPLEKKNGDTVSLPYGMYITVNGFDGYVFITDDCKVDKYGLHHSDIPNGEYTMKFIDRAKITSLFAADEYKLPPLETPLARRIFYISLIAIVAFIVAFAIGFVVKKKRGAAK